MKVKFERVYKKYSIGDIAEIDNKEELDYLINTKTIILLEEEKDFETSEIEEIPTEKAETKSNKGKNRK